MILAVAPKMRQQRDGSIVNLSSLVGLVPLPFWGYYSASKFAVEGLTEALREELRPFGIRVSAVEPGTIKTALYTAGPKARSMEAYAPRRGRFEKVMRQFEERAPGPEVVAEKVARIVHSRSPALRNPITSQARVLPLLRAWFPRSWLNAGSESTMVLWPEVRGALAATPSEAMTRTEITSPLSPLPATERSSVGLVWPVRLTPFLRH